MLLLPCTAFFQYNQCMGTSIHRNNNLIIFIASILSVTVIALVIRYKFGFYLTTNDDVMLRSIASGNYTGTPDAHLIYIMYPLGLIFKGLYRFFPDVLWYDCFMIFVHFLCIFLIIYKISSAFRYLSNKIVAMMISTAVLMIVDCSSIVFHQYTILSGVCAATGILWVALSDRKTDPMTRKAVTIIMFLLSLWLRKQMFLLSVPVLLVVLILKSFDRDNDLEDRRLEMRSLVAPGAVLLGLIALSFVIDGIPYSSDEWKAFKDYNHARAEVYDFNKLPDYASNADLYESLGLKERDYAVLQEYDVALLDGIDAGTYEALANRADIIKKERERMENPIFNAVVDAVSYILNEDDHIGGALTIISLILIVFLLIRGKRLAGLLTFAVLLYQWCFIVLFTYLERLPKHVSHGFYMIELMTLAGILVRVLVKSEQRRAESLSDVDSSKLRPVKLVICAVLMMVLGIIGLFVLRNLSYDSAARRCKAKEWAEMNRYFNSNTQNVYIINTSCYATMPGLMFDGKEAEAPNLIKAGNWTLESPLDDIHNERLISGSVRDALIHDDNVFFVQVEGKSTDWLSDCFGSVTLIDTFDTSEGYSYCVYSLKQ